MSKMELPKVPEDIIVNIMVWRNLPDTHCNYQILSHPDISEECCNELTNATISILIGHKVISPICDA